MTIYTIGYEGLTIDDFMDALDAFEIEMVVDIRERPQSRKPGFSKTALSAHLFRAKIGYAHMASLGCPKHIRDQYRIDGDWSRYTSDFLKHLDAQQHSVIDLSKQTHSSTCALLCFEADFNRCHRSLVADRLETQFGAQIKHIAASKKEGDCMFFSHPPFRRSSFAPIEDEERTT